MPYTVKRIGLHTAVLVAGPFETYPDAKTTLQDMQRLDPGVRYEVHNEGGFVEEPVAGPVILDTPVSDFTTEELSMQTHERVPEIEAAPPVDPVIAVPAESVPVALVEPVASSVDPVPSPVISHE